MELQQTVVEVNPFEGWHFRVRWHEDGYTWGFYIGRKRKSSPSPVYDTLENCESAIRNVNVVALPVWTLGYPTD